MNLRINNLTLEKVEFFLLCVLMIDCCIFGAGRTVSVGPIGFRLALSGALVILSIPLLIVKHRSVFRNKFLCIFLSFSGWLIIQTVIGIMRGNNISLILSDLKGFAYIALVLPVLCVLTEKKRIQKLMKVMMYSSAVLGIAGIFFLCVYNWCPTIFWAFYRFDNHFHISVFASVSDKILRVFFKSSNYLMCGCAFPLYFILTEKHDKFHWQYPSIIGLDLFVLLLSYTRSIYLGMALAGGAVLILCVCFAWGKCVSNLMKNLGISVMVFATLLISFNVIMNADYLGYAFDRLSVTLEEPGQENMTPGMDQNLGDVDRTDKYQDATKQSDELRRKTMDELLELISESPIIGHGLGKSLTVRESGYNEYFYLDLMLKTGVIGLMLYVMPVALMFFGIIKRNKLMAENRLVAGLWLSVLMGFMVFSFFNPYMNASLGISFYCCTIGVFCCVENKPNKNVLANLV